CFRELVVQYKCDIHAFVIMGNHYHLMISTPEKNIGECMKYLHREVAKRANKSVGRINHFFGGRYKWSMISDEGYYWNCVKYVFRNPVKAGLCNDVKRYPYSSLNQQLTSFSWKMTDFFCDRQKLITLETDWLNEPFLNEEEELITNGLRRREFTLPKDRKGGIPTLTFDRQKRLL
ncbi:MAG: transposase, partial [Pseudobdellovibrionaceae bacterium]